MSKAVVNLVETLGKNDAGPKAKSDIQSILVNQGYESLTLPITIASIKDKLKLAYWDLPNFFRKHGDFDEYVLQYPIYSKIVTKRLFKTLRNVPGKLILVIHDIESLRFQTDDDKSIQHEIHLLNQADGLIVHTQAMQTWLQDHGVTVPMKKLELFDYLNSQPLLEKINYEKSVCYAGNLMKSSFLGTLNLNGYKLSVFGPNPLPNFPDEINYLGVRTPDELPKELKYNFGLVWDGTTTATCDGIFGEYMKFNSPHKVSLYLSTGLPVIIWKQAAVASYIVNNQLGIAIDSLDNLPAILDSLSDEEYQILKKSVLSYANRLRKGQNIINVLSDLENELA